MRTRFATLAVTVVATTLGFAAASTGRAGPLASAGQRRAPPASQKPAAISPAAISMVVYKSPT